MTAEASPLRDLFDSCARVLAGLERHDTGGVTNRAAAVVEDLRDPDRIDPYRLGHSQGKYKASNLFCQYLNASSFVLWFEAR